jgi:hypothetical protein
LLSDEFEESGQLVARHASVTGLLGRVGPVSRGPNLLSQRICVGLSLRVGSARERDQHEKCDECRFSQK